MSTTILSGVVGSTAYGLAREGSDVDRLQIHVAPTVEVAGLDWNPRRESVVSTSPDVTSHEIGKACRLLLGCNPTVMELLWLDQWEVPIHDLDYQHGWLLTQIRGAFLSEPAVRNAYGGYATQQLHRLRNSADGTFSADTRKRTVKHGRHLLRLLRQGRELLETGRLVVKVPDPESYFAFDDYTVEQMVEVYDRELALFNAAESSLPAAPDTDGVRCYLTSVRRAYLEAR